MSPLSVLFTVLVAVSASPLITLVMVSVELMIRNPSASAIAVLTFVIILPPSADGDQVMEGAGTPLAVQIKETALPSTSVTDINSESGVAISTGAA